MAYVHIKLFNYNPLVSQILLQYQRAETYVHLLQQKYEFFDLELFCRRKRNRSHEKHLKKFNTGYEKLKLIEVIIGITIDIVYELYSFMI